MKINRFLLIVFGLFFTVFQAQDAKEIAKQRAKLKLFDEEKVNNINSKYLEKIVFANSEIRDNDPESKYISSYNFGDKLYIRSFLANSIANDILIQLVEKGVKAKVLNESNSTTGFANISYKLYLDGKEVAMTQNSNLHLDHTSSLTDMSCINDTTERELFGEELYMKLLNRPELLTSGKHKMKIEAIAICPNCPKNIIPDRILAVGEIDMVIPNVIKITESDCFPKKQWSDPKLENEALRAFKNTPDVYKVILTDRDYTVVKNEYGIVLRKGFIAAVVFKKGNDVYYEYINFERIFDGATFQSLKVGDMMSLPDRVLPKGKKVNADCLKYLK